MDEDANLAVSTVTLDLDLVFVLLATAESIVRQHREGTLDVGTEKLIVTVQCIERVRAALPSAILKQYEQLGRRRSVKYENI